MKSGEVAVENSVNAFREHKSNKLKDRVTMTPLYSARPPSMVYPQPVYEPYQLQYAPSPYGVLPHQPLPYYQRYNIAEDKQNSINFDNGVGQHQRLHPATTHSVKRSIKSTQPTAQPPLSLPSTGSNRSKPRRAVCMQYVTRGYCNYGELCRYTHEPPSDPSIPTSAPARIHDVHQAMAQPISRVRRSAERSRHDVDFPALSVDTNLKRSAPTDQRDTASSLTSPLVFRDAVLNQTSSPRKPRNSPPTRAATTEELIACANDQVKMRSRETEPGRIHRRFSSADQSDDPRRERLIPDHVSMHSVTTLPRPEDNHRYLQLLEPEPGCTAYAIQSVYVAQNAFGTDDSAAFSSLSRDASSFVKRLDAKLYSLIPIQRRAISHLQDVAHSLWNESVLDVYGSNYTRLALPMSDVDCVLTLPKHTDQEPAQALRLLADELKHHEWAGRIELLDTAKIPVLKVVFSTNSKSNSDVMLDLTCSHSPGHSGLGARDLIYSYQVEMPALRPLVLILKTHIQRQGLNCAFTGGLSSYGLVLLAIRFLQACGDKHHIANAPVGDARLGGRARSVSEGGAILNSQGCRDTEDNESFPIYEFARDGKLTWRTGLGNLLLLFLETYVTFDYRQFGITIVNAGEYFPLPAEKIAVAPAAVVSPYIVDPIKPERSIGNCFRMHEVIQSWYTLYEQVTSGFSLEDAINSTISAIRAA